MMYRLELFNDPDLIVVTVQSREPRITYTCSLMLGGTTRDALAMPAALRAQSGVAAGTHRHSPVCMCMSVYFQYSEY